MRSTRHLSLIDLMAVIGATGVGLSCLRLFPPSDRFYDAQFVIGPIVGILWHRLRGGRGILGGTLGGTAYAAIFLVCVITERSINDRITIMEILMNTAPMLVIFFVITAVLGAIMGCAAWLMATAMGRPRVASSSPATSADVDPELN